VRTGRLAQSPSLAWRRLGSWHRGRLGPGNGSDDSAPPIAQRQPPSGPAPSTREASSQAAPASAPTGRAFWGSFATRLLIFGVVVGLVGIPAMLVSR